MNQQEKLSYLKDNHLCEFLRAREHAYNYLSGRQVTFCCCGRLATALHEKHCNEFNKKVDAETIKILSYLLPKEGYSDRDIKV